MATYTNIQGQNILIVSSDPANPTVGQMWYNTTSNALKAYADVGAWATGGNLPVAQRGVAGAGTQTAALSAGGVSGHLKQHLMNMMELHGQQVEI
jgi:hypothetical protein